MTEGQNTFSQANWFVDLENVRGAVSAKAVYFSKIAKQLKNKALHLVVLETKKQALFFTSDIYNFFDEENVYYLPLSGEERSKESLKGVSEKVQRTSALAAIENFSAKVGCDDLPQALGSCRSVDIGEGLRDRKAGRDQTVVVCYLDSLKEKVLRKKTTRESVVSIAVGQRIGHELLRLELQDIGFAKVDFVTRPGEFALRGSIIDIRNEVTMNIYKTLILLKNKNHFDFNFLSITFTISKTAIPAATIASVKPLSSPVLGDLALLAPSTDDFNVAFSTTTATGERLVKVPVTIPSPTVVGITTHPPFS